MVSTYIFPIFTLAAIALVVWFLFINRNQNIKIKVHNYLEEEKLPDKPDQS